MDRKERERENRRVITKLYIYIFFEEMEGFEVTVCLGDVSTLAIVGK